MIFTRRQAFVAMAAPAALRAARNIEHPVGQNSRFPTLHFSNQKLLLSWVEQDPNGARRFQFAEQEGGIWSPSTTIAEGERLMLNWADFPSMFPLSDGGLAAQWLERNVAPGGYGVRIAIRPSGQTRWINAYTTTSGGEGYEGFVSFAELGEEIYAAFLDHLSDQTSLRVARISRGGKLLALETVDPDVCSCCQTAIVSGNGSLLLAYRDHSSGEIRDISFARRSSGVWLRDVDAPRDHWRINGCPVNGPALDRTGQAVAAAWYTGSPTPRVQVSVSKDGGRSFRTAIRIDDGSPLGRSCVAALPKASGSEFAIGWLERTPTGARFRVRCLGHEGTLLRSAIDISPVSPARSSGFPQLAAAPDGLYAAWTGLEGVTVTFLPYPL